MTDSSLTVSTVGGVTMGLEALELNSRPFVQPWPRLDSAVKADSNRS